MYAAAHCTARISSMSLLRIQSLFLSDITTVVGHLARRPTSGKTQLSDKSFAYHQSFPDIGVLRPDTTKDGRITALAYFTMSRTHQYRS
jgi:hypothetical protein